MTKVRLPGFIGAHLDMYYFPIKRFAKDPPCFKNNLALASNDIQQLGRWSLEYKNPNWGVSLKKSGLIVVDIDCKEGKHGADTLQTLELINGELPATLTVRSPSGGLHYYFRETNIVQHVCRLGKAGFGLDVDSPNYTLVAGCRLRRPPGLINHDYWNGSHNAPDRPQYVVERDLPIAPAPDWFAEYLRPDNSAEVDQIPVVEQDTPDLVDWAIHYLENDAPPSVEGNNGEHQTLMVAAVLKDRGISEQKAIELMEKHYNHRCSPPWRFFDGATADRMDVKIHNAWLYLKQTQPGADTPEANFGGDTVSAADLAVRVAISDKHEASQYVARNFTVIDGKLMKVRPPRRKRKIV